MSKTTPKNDKPNFAALLEARPTEVDRPKPLPQGSYVCVVKGLPEYGESSKKKTPFVKFNLQPTAAMDDVDEGDLKAMGGFANKTIRATFYLTEDAVYRLDEFHEHCGLELNPKVSRRQRNEEAVNQQVIAFIKHTSSEDGQSTYAELGKTAPVEE